MALVNKKKSWLKQVQADADRLTRRRMEDAAHEHEAKEELVNTLEGVTAGTPVRQAALVNPAEPDLTNFTDNAESSLSGVKPSVEKQSNAPSVQTDGLKGAKEEAPVKEAPKKETK